MNDPVFDEDVDRSAEHRLALIRTVVLTTVFTALLAFAGLPLMQAGSLAFGTALIILCRSTAIERFVFTQAEAYAKEIVGRHAGVFLDVLRNRPDIATAYERHGLAVRHLLACRPDDVRAAAHRLRAAGYPDRRLRQPRRSVVRLATAGTGLLIAVVLGRMLESAGVCSPTGVAALWSAVTWPNRLILLAGLLVAVASRAGAAWHNRRELLGAGDGFARRPTDEVFAMLGPPWRARRAAVVADLHRVLAVVRSGGAITDEELGLRRWSELVTLEWLFATGLVTGVVASLAVSC
ncbi:hypothetical protein [Catenuloplanes atrovinosus]|uniref:Uncharacterized protein n=1 Tax=Catenuloplanes atrovinosus TaxID=137266 RepID=A0AAE3YKE4_9ACTN|nr:hypothetical protein [Catenuloplanes atrovinosus]MDR7275404.1 hypothetical protein [Catenuloplanes atrovinosus]